MFFTADIHDGLLGGVTIIAAMHNPTQFRLCDHQSQRIGFNNFSSHHQRLIILADQNWRLSQAHLSVDMGLSSSGNLHQLQIQVWNGPSTTHNMPFRLRSNTSNLEGHIFSFFILFGDLVHPATAERQLWTISTNLLSKGCIDKSSRRRFVT
jgi:hypothetical protein